MDLFTSRELLIIGVVVGTLIFIVLLLTIWDMLSKRKKEDEDIEEMLDNIDKEVIKDTVMIEENKSNPVEIIETIDIKKDNVVAVEEKEEKKIEIETLIIDDDQDNQIEKLEVDTKEKAKIELLKIEKELENPKTLEDTLYNLEMVEEENAIISYQQLLENTKELNVVSTDNGDEPISINEIFNMYKEDSKIVVDKEMTNVSINEAYNSNFTSTPYLSPIVGFEKDNASLAEIQLENTANLEKLDKEIRKTNEFLTILNDLKKNLD